MQALLFFLSKGARRLGFISFSVLFYRVTRLLVLVSKIRIKDPMKAYFCYLHMLL